jgi:hypothetical protein
MRMQGQKMVLRRQDRNDMLNRVYAHNRTAVSVAATGRGTLNLRDWLKSQQRLAHKPTAAIAATDCERTEQL